jgi:hypothetical protein
LIRSSHIITIWSEVPISLQFDQKFPYHYNLIRSSHIITIWSDVPISLKFDQKFPYHYNLIRSSHIITIWSEVPISLQFDQKFFCPFQPKIVHQYVCTWNSYNLLGIYLKLISFLLLYEDSHMVKSIWSEHFWRSYCPFRSEYIIKKLVRWTPVAGIFCSCARKQALIYIQNFIYFLWCL